MWEWIRFPTRTSDTGKQIQYPKHSIKYGELNMVAELLNSFLQVLFCSSSDVSRMGGGCVWTDQGPADSDTKSPAISALLKISHPKPCTHPVLSCFSWLLMSTLSNLILYFIWVFVLFCWCLKNLNAIYKRKVYCLNDMDQQCCKWTFLLLVSL